MTGTGPALALRGVRKVFRKGDVEVVALDGVDVEVGRGEFAALIGPSGSGKSTLLHLVAGIDRPTAGRVEVLGDDITDWDEDRLAAWRTRAVGVVFQQFNLMPVLTARENVELPLLLLPLERQRRQQIVNTALELVGLTDRADHYPRQLSGGQEQRVAIARALATDPQIIIADEPTGALDRTTAGSVMDLLAELHAKHGKTVIVVTHDPAVAGRTERTLRLDKGVLVEVAPEATA